ncbi:hypothetical protein [Fluviicola sp.]|jgi:hypothetical protein|uniref:hypothetical protein n=1 Tax=Fluviicola sp. TaxID=1917219 RepID=UPI00281FF344|nr:hypothetical protein [Fluviicola sp.]MDR0801159.1 hypothetical protein [Fluviicola sp.]
MISERIVLLAVLTAGMYGLSTLMRDGVFLLPFVLYKLGMFLVAVILLIANKTKIRWQEGVLLLWTGFLALSSKFIYEIVCSHRYLSEHRGELQAFSTWCLLGFVVFFFIWQVLIALLDKTIFRWLQIINASLIMICFFMNMFEWMIVPFWMWILSIFLSRNENSLHKSLAGLYGFVFLSSWISALYFGKEAVLAVTLIEF